MGTGACNKDELGDKCGPRGDYEEGALVTCLDACWYVRDCQGFEGEVFGEDLDSCHINCANVPAEDLQAVLDCLNGTVCSEPLAIAACEPTG